MRGKDNGIFGVELEGEWEHFLANCFSLSTKGNGFGVEVDYQVVKDYCLKYEADAIETFWLLKRICGEVYKKS